MTGVRLLIVLSVLASSMTVLAQPLVLGSAQKEFSAGPYIKWWIDNNSEHQIDDVSNNAMLEWHSSGEIVPNLGYHANPVWFHFQIVNPEGLRDWNLVVDYPLIRDLGLYLFRDNQLQGVFHLGDRFEFAARPVLHRNFVVPLELDQGATFDVYIRAAGPYAIQMPVSLMQSSTLLEKDTYRVIAHGLFFGFVVVMGVYNLFLFASTREITYLLYVVFTFAIGMFQFVEQGFAYQFFWPKEVWWQNKATGVWLHLSLIASFLFVISFLNLRKNIASMYRFFQFSILLCLSALLVSPFVDEGWIIRLGVVVAIPVSFACVICGLIVWRKGRRDARIFSIAWSTFLIGVVLLALNKLGYIPRTMMTEHGAEIGTVLELALLAFALAGRIKLERSRRQDIEQHARELERAALIAKEHALELEKMNSEQLERNVRSRTRDLHKALSELSQVNRKLEQLNRVDSVTGVGNENSFLASLSQEWDRSYREGEVLSLIVVELDNYRQVLADYGQVAADECLRAVATVLERLIARPADCITRYGDKVFGIILPGTDEKGADYLAARVVEEVASQPCDFGTGKVQLSVSVGVAAKLPRKAGQFKDVLMSAESAVYVAKNSGGNRVELADVNP